MNSTYNHTWLLAKFDRDDAIEYIFFWSHVNRARTDIGKFVLSQWHYSPFTVDKEQYRTAEHWMMAKKAILFGDHQCLTRILAAEKPGEVKEIGRQIEGFDQATWERERYRIVREGCTHKFNQNQKLKDFLLATGDKVLVEASPTDFIWGIGLAEDSPGVENPHSWKGPNLLGFALMEVRDILRNNSK